MFKSLDEEDEKDIDIICLNAYRTHFKLADLIPSAKKPQVTKIVHKVEEFEPEAIVEEIVIPEESIEIEEIVEEFIDPQEYEIEQIIDEDEYEESSMYVEVLDEDDRKMGEHEKFFVFACHVCSLQFPRFKMLRRHCKDVHNCLP
jgi:hypothetical protein